MKQFFGAFFGSLVGFIVATLLVILLVVLVVKTSINSIKEDKEEVALVKPNSIIRLTLDGRISEREKENPFRQLGENIFPDNEGLGLNQLVKKIKAARNDKNVKGIFLHIKKLESGFAKITELREALKEFRNSGKFIYAYSEDYSLKEYFIASVANEVYLNPEGNIDWTGISMQLVFFKRMFEKLDVDMQVFRHGKFKSAVEPFMFDKMSESNRLQSESFLNSIWNSMLAEIASSRKLTITELNRMADNLEIRFPSDAVGKLVDATLYEDEVHARLKKAIAMKESDKIKFVELAKYNHRDSGVKLNAAKLAVIYANGPIGSGEGTDDEIGSERLAKAIREARLDDKIKAIVLRVNSPGGSALASDVIWREVVLAKRAKPIVVSMGDLAASGGYYISCAAGRIFAEPNTITGSIGVFGLLPNFKKTLENKLGITIDTVNTNRYSDMGTPLRAVSQKEFEFIQGSVEKVYDTFTKRVAEGRGLSQAQVDSLGQGRVWSGSEAIGIGLIDELGGLDKAVAYAAREAKLSEYKIVELPKQKGPFDGLFEKSENEVEDRLLQKKLGPTYLYFKQLSDILKVKGVQARLPFEIIFETNR
jgi:protease IV